MNLTPTQTNVRIDKTHKRYVLKRPRLPHALDIPVALRAQLDATERTLVSLPSAEAGALEQRIHHLNSLSPNAQSQVPQLTALRHRFGEMSVARLQSSIRPRPERSTVERHVLDQRCGPLLQSIEASSAEAFMAEIQTIAAMVKGEAEAAFRTGGVRLVGDKQGWSWQFPDAEGISECLKSLHAFLRNKQESRIALATIAYGILNWMHPFTDGNGRTSRVVFNTILRGAGMAQGHYIPIKEINHLAHGGHEVRLRYTVAMGEWQELLEYFVNAAALYKVLLQSEASSVDSGPFNPPGEEKLI